MPRRHCLLPSPLSCHLPMPPDGNLSSYDIEGMNDEEAVYVSRTILSMVQRDELVSELPPCSWTLGVEMLSGQFDQRSDSTSMCIQLVYPHLHCTVRCATFYCFDSELTDEEKLRIRTYSSIP